MSCKILCDSSGRVICELTIANTALSRAKGLLFSEPLSDGFGLLISPCNSIHMFFMNYAIDAIYFDKFYKVMKIIKNLKPWRVSSCLLASSVLELRSGSSEALGFEVGKIYKVEINE